MFASVSTACNSPGKQKSTSSFETIRSRQASVRISTAFCHPKHSVLRQCNTVSLITEPRRQTSKAWFCLSFCYNEGMEIQLRLISKRPNDNFITSMQSSEITKPSQPWGTTQIKSQTREQQVHDSIVQTYWFLKKCTLHVDVLYILSFVYIVTNFHWLLTFGNNFLPPSDVFIYRPAPPSGTPLPPILIVIILQSGTVL